MVLDRLELVEGHLTSSYCKSSSGFLVTMGFFVRDLIIENLTEDFYVKKIFLRIFNQIRSSKDLQVTEELLRASQPQKVY